LVLANQTSYLKPGLVVVFFWGVFWPKTNPTVALLVLVSSPLIGFGCDVFYVFEARLSHKKAGASQLVNLSRR
jgi:hypothetical protein